MKNSIKISLLIFGLFLLASCTTAKTLPEKFNRKWMLIEFKDFSKEELMKNNAYLDLSIKGQYSAKMGCNNIFMKAEFKNNNQILFSNIGATKMFCNDKMKLEDEFNKILPTMNQYKIEGHFLTLISKDGEKMKFVAEDWD